MATRKKQSDIVAKAREQRIQRNLTMATPVQAMDAVDAQVASEQLTADRLGKTEGGRKLLRESGMLAPHLNVQAKAGTGKTSTLIGGLLEMKGQYPGFKPTKQQEAIWAALGAGPKPRSIKLTSFSNAICKELAERAPEGVDVSTMHSFGYSAVKKQYRMGGKYAVDKYKTSRLLEVIVGKDLREVRKDKPMLENGVMDLVNICKQTLTGVTFITEDDKENVGEGQVRLHRMERQAFFDAGAIDDEELLDLCQRYDIETNGSQQEIFEFTRMILEQSRQIQDMDKKKVDFSDMIWVPVVNNLPVWRYDLLLVDEAQDLNPCQQELAMKAGERIVLCGDNRQAIYGFAGADVKSMETMTKRLGASERGVEEYPLNQTFRCGKVIVAAAQKIVPDYFAFEKNPEGEEIHLGLEKLKEIADNGDMVICRTNAPLVSVCFSLLVSGKKATIVGADVGVGLKKLINKLCKADSTTDAGDLMVKVDDWHDAEAKKMAKSKYGSDMKLIALKDKRDCLLAFCEGCVTVDEVIGQIDKMFVENTQPGVRLSSIHRAKGLEATNVYILTPENMPHPMAKTADAVGQEWNLKYVAITRAKLRLGWVSE